MSVRQVKQFMGDIFIYMPIKGAGGDACDADMDGWGHGVTTRILGPSQNKFEKEAST